MPDKKRILDTIRTPHQLKRLGEEDLETLAGEVREEIINVVSQNGGHLASNLGMTELTIALHSVFDFSNDALLWDVGHQCYAHKLLTGRREKFQRLRKSDGVSGFPAPDESEYDLFATGHAGTAISTAMGMAFGNKRLSNDRKVVAVVGDASIVNGLSMEGINNAPLIDRQLLIILNDNSMAIDRTRGAMASVLDRIRLTHAYSDFKQSADHLLSHIPMGEEISEAIRNIKTGLKTTIHGGKIFEALGFNYFGPVDGHDLDSLVRQLKRLSEIDGPVLLHVHTQKGRGCQYAVEDPCRFHSPSAYTVENGKAVFEPKQNPTWTQVFSETLVEQAQQDERIVAITAAMPDGTGLVEFREKFPDRCLDVGICESHATSMAGGLAKAGLKPVVAIYSTFMQRAMDQVFQESALQKLPVIFCMDRAGLVGSDGAVHHGFMDIAYLRPLPGMTLMAPADRHEMAAAMKLALTLEGPCAIRYPRDEVGPDLDTPCPPFEIGKARTCRDGDDGTFLCYGTTVEPAMGASQLLEKDHDYSVGVVNARFAKPLDVTTITNLLKSGKPVIICEDHSKQGGFGSAVLELAAERGLDASNVRLCGLPDRFISHASRLEQLIEVGLDATHLSETMTEMIHHPEGSPARKYF